jgi:hypothetical protein
MQCQFSEYYGFPSCTPLPLELDGELQVSNSWSQMFCYKQTVVGHRIFTGELRVP